MLPHVVLLGKLHCFAQSTGGGAARDVHTFFLWNPLLGLDMCRCPPCPTPRVQLHQAGWTANAVLNEHNNIVAMANAGSKGGLLNISQIIACVGQQSVEGQVGRALTSSLRVPFSSLGNDCRHFAQTKECHLSPPTPILACVCVVPSSPSSLVCLSSHVQRIPYGFKDRTLPHFRKHDLGAPVSFAVSSADSAPRGGCVKYLTALAQKSVF